MPFPRPKPSHRATPPVMEGLEGRALRSATIVVENANDAGGGSLRQALADAVAGDTVDCTGLIGTLTLSTGLVIDKDVTVQGPGAGVFTISGNGGRAQGFAVAAGLHVTISGLKIDRAGFPGVPNESDPAHGGAIEVSGDIDHERTALTLDRVVLSNNVGYEAGGALSVAFCDLTMTDCRVTRNTATGYNDAMGGGVYATYSTLTATGCTFDNNKAVATGAASPGWTYPLDTTALGGGLCLMGAGRSTMTNCTVAANFLESTPQAAGGGGAFAFGGGLLVSAEADFSLVNCTIASNTVSNAHGCQGFGGGIDVFDFGTTNPDAADTLRVTNCIVANNYAGTGVDALGLDVPESVGKTVLKNNLFAVAEESGVTAGTDGNLGGTRFIPLDARLNTLDDNGGPTPTMSLRAGSPAIGAAATALLPPFDQRGLPRGGGGDIGAFAYASNYAPFLRGALPPPVATLGRPFSTTLRVGDAENDPLRIVLSSAPKWLTAVDNGDGTATLSGTPGEGDVGDADLVLSISDGHQTVTPGLSLVVDAPPVDFGGDGILRVFGTAAADDIHVWQPRGAGTAVRVVANGRTWNYDAAAVRSVRVYGYAGDDVLVANSYIRTAISAGTGDDRAAGGFGPDTVYGGDGDDSIDGGAGDNALYGNGGDDKIGAGVGADNLFGGDGRDTLDGGAGSDVYRGEAGRDVVLCRDGVRDRVISIDADGDRAQADDKDVVADVITLLA